MGPRPPRRRPAYAVRSVDNALRLIEMLRDLGPIRGKEAAAELGIAPSTANRLLSMLVYRGFAVQDESRAYHPGPALGLEPTTGEEIRRLVDSARPVLAELTDLVEESTNLTVLTGDKVRFVLTAVSARSTSAGDRQGFVLPAHLTAAGRVTLSRLKADQVLALYADYPDSTRSRLLHELDQVRFQGYAVSSEESEIGIASVAMAVEAGCSAALSVAAPVRRLARLTGPETLSRLAIARDTLGARLGSG